MTVKVMIAREQFVGALREVRKDLAPEQIVVDAIEGTRAIGFVGSAKDLAVFMLEARERFGPYDSALLAQIVIAFATTRSWCEFAFPGLELY